MVLIVLSSWLSILFLSHFLPYRDTDKKSLKKKARERIIPNTRVNKFVNQKFFPQVFRYSETMDSVIIFWSLVFLSFIMWFVRDHGIKTIKLNLFLFEFQHTNLCRKSTFYGQKFTWGNPKLYGFLCILFLMQHSQFYVFRIVKWVKMYHIGRPKFRIQRETPLKTFVRESWWKCSCFAIQMCLWWYVFKFAAFYLGYSIIFQFSTPPP